MRDGTSISLGGTSAFEIQTYAAYGPSPILMGRMFGSIIRIITGKIAKMNPEGTVIQTPHANVGIRGTDYILRFNESENTTEVFVLYSTRDVLLNGTPIKSGQKGSVGKRGDIPAVGIVTPEGKQKLNRLVPAARGADMSDIDKSITTENSK